MKNIRLILIVASVLTLGMISCSKKGDTGPTGATGPVGPTGPDSVVYSNWINLSFTYNATDSAYVDTLAASSLTKAILDSGVILTYMNFPETNGTFHVVPMSALASDGLIENYSVGAINIKSFVGDLTGYQYRYVTIPGSKVAGNSANKSYKRYSVAELKAMPFTQVQKIVAGTGN